MKISVVSKGPGRWSVFQSIGLSANVAAGRIVRTQSLGAAKTYFFDLGENRHELGSLPKAWPNQIKRILESNHVRTTQ
ncbi:hypothetical protein [Pseudomonas phage PSA28]|nr:hypothetical protein [Pseudomonas phage PSA28]